MFFDEKALGKKSDRDISRIRLLKSPAIMASGISTILSLENPNERCDRLKLFSEEKQAGKNSDIITEEIIAIADKIFEHKCISTKQPNFFYINVQTKRKVCS